MTYIVYGFSDCPYCTKAKQFLEDIEEPYEAIFIEDAQDRRIWLDERGFEAPNRTLPRIFERDAWGKEKLVGGYRELLNEFSEN